MKRAFTLAEVLITIGLVGIVAALTLPVLNRHIQARFLKTKFDKHYAELCLAVEKMLAQNDYVSFATYSSNESYVNAFNSNFGNGVTICNNTENDSCGTSSLSVFYNISGGSTIEGISYYYTTESIDRILFPDGAILYMQRFPNDNSPLFTLDINGLKEKPNRIGYDVFIFKIDLNKNYIIPFGFNQSPEYFCERYSSYSPYCSALAVKDPNYFKSVVNRIKL